MNHESAPITPIDSLESLVDRFAAQFDPDTDRDSDALESISGDFRGDQTRADASPSEVSANPPTFASILIDDPKSGAPSDDNNRTPGHGYQRLIVCSHHPRGNKPSIRVASRRLRRLVDLAGNLIPIKPATIKGPRIAGR